MRRRTGHGIFAGVALGCAVLAGYQGFRLVQARSVNEAIAAFDAAKDQEPSIAGRLKSAAAAPEDKVPGDAPGGAAGDAAGNAAGDAAGDAASDVPGSLSSHIPEAQFAHALALARGGDPDAAFKAYKTIAQGSRADLRVAALYNIGNLHMREAARKGADDPTQLLPLVELAKQSYRDVLREQPGNWDARYNLERALQLAPEVEDVPVEEEETDAPEEHVSSTLQGAKMDLP
ncbi:MAG: MxaK protein [Gammaproteobacteria bacterium]